MCPNNLFCPLPPWSSASGGALAATVLERQAVSLLLRNAPGALTIGWDLNRRCFHLRAVLLPTLFHEVLRKWTDPAEPVRLGLGEFSSYILAHRRTRLECLLRSIHRDQAHGGTQPMHTVLRGHEDSGKTLMQLVEAAPEGYRFWLRRFDDWRRAAMASRQHHLKRCCPGTGAAEQEVVHASLVAGAGELGWLPAILLTPLIAGFPWECEAAVKKLLYYHKKLKGLKRNQRPEIRLRPEEIDTWLIEAWPVIQEYNWRYDDVWRVARLRFCYPRGHSLESPEEIEDRCRYLGLRLSLESQRKRGRRKPTVPPLRDMALLISGIAAEPREWIAGRFYAKQYK